MEVSPKIQHRPKWLRNSVDGTPNINISAFIDRPEEYHPKNELVHIDLSAYAGRRRGFGGGGCEI